MREIKISNYQDLPGSYRKWLKKNMQQTAVKQKILSQATFLPSLYINNTIQQKD